MGALTKSRDHMPLWSTACLEDITATPQLEARNLVTIISRHLFSYIPFQRLSFITYITSTYCNYFFLYILLSHVPCSKIWNLVDYKVLIPVAILFCILTTCYYINYVFHEVLLTNLPVLQYSYGYCKMYSWLYQLLLCPKDFLWDFV